MEPGCREVFFSDLLELARIRSLVLTELAAVALLMLCAALMAKGIGYLG